MPDRAGGGVAEFQAELATMAPQPPDRIIVLAVPGCLGSALLGALDLLALARQGLRARGDARDIAVASASRDGAAVTDGHGRSHGVDLALSEVSRCAAVLVPGFVPIEAQAPSFDPALPEAQFLRAHFHVGAAIAASCSGVFLAGAAGLLEGRRCTTTWWLHDALRTRHPRADAAFGSALVQDGRLITAGGPMSWIDCAFALLRRLIGAEATRRAADYAVVDTSPSSQAVYVPAGHFNAADPFLIEAERAVRLGGPEVTPSILAARLNISERTLHRRLAARAGRAPRAFIEAVRFDLARTALQSGPRSVQQIAAECGFADETSFRRAFKRCFGLTPSAYRQRFRPRAPETEGS